MVNEGHNVMKDSVLNLLFSRESRVVEEEIHALLTRGTYEVREVLPEILLVQLPKIFSEVGCGICWAVLRGEEDRDQVLVAFVQPRLRNCLQ